MTLKSLAPLSAVLLALCLIAAPTATAERGPSAAASAKQKAKKAWPVTQDCSRFARAVRSKGGAAKRSAKRSLRNCKKGNKARAIAFRQINGYKFVGARGDGMAVDWRQCKNGAWLHYSDGNYGRSVSFGKRWNISHAIVRKGGKWFDAVVTGPVKGGASQVGISRRGKKWTVSIASFGTNLSSPGEVKRSKISNRDCIRT